MVFKRKNKAGLTTLILILTALFAGGAMAGGEKYVDQGHALFEEIDKELIRRGICNDAKDCYQKLQIYGEHGNQVNFNIYGIADSNRRAIAAIAMEIVVSRGIRITNGVPIGIKAFPKPHDEYVNFKNFFSKKPIISLEVTE